MDFDCMGWDVLNPSLEYQNHSLKGDVPIGVVLLTTEEDKGLKYKREAQFFCTGWVWPPLQSTWEVA